MRKLQAGIAVSAAVHAAVVAWAATRTPAATPIDAPSAKIEIIEVTRTAPEVAPIEVALLDDPPIVAPSAERAGAAASQIAVAARSPATSTDVRDARDARDAAAIAGAAITMPGTGRGSAQETPAHRSPWMDMRRHGVDIRLPHDDYGGAVDTAPAGTAPEVDQTTGLLAPAGNGTYRSDLGVFVARVSPDGTAKLKDAKNFHIHLALPSPREIGRGIADWYAEDNKIPNDPEKVAINNHRPVDTDTRPDHGGTVPILGGGFDVTDALMRGHGQDPYASKKLAYLDSTRDERVQIGTRHRQQQLAAAPRIVRKNLDRLWATVADPGARKQMLFEMWDECAETGSEDLITAGAAARRLVIGFVRAHLPAGAAGAYTADEIAALNRRKQSTATFAPYE